MKYGVLQEHHPMNMMPGTIYPCLDIIEIFNTIEEAAELAGLIEDDIDYNGNRPQIFTIHPVTINRIEVMARHVELNDV